MKLLIVGDFKGNTGPASVNKTIRGLDPSIQSTTQTNKIMRIVEMVYKIKKSDYIIFSGLSKLNLMGLKVAKAFGKKSAYLMHGYTQLEAGLEGEVNLSGGELEKELLYTSTNIICVSKMFMEYMKKTFKDIDYKFNYVMNPINTETFKMLDNMKKDNNLIMSVGGGKRNKRILKVCEAIEMLNSTKNTKYRLLVVGGAGVDTEKIKNYDFVQYIENLEYSRMSECYSKAKLYIQNSEFETFGLAAMEAVMCDCNLVISKNVGCKDILGDGMKPYIIEDIDLASEIASKIEYAMENENNSYLKEKIYTRSDILSEFKKIMGAK